MAGRFLERGWTLYRADSIIALFADFQVSNISLLFTHLSRERNYAHRFLIFDVWTSNCRNDFSFQYISE